MEVYVPEDLVRDPLIERLALGCAVVVNEADGPAMGLQLPEQADELQRPWRVGQLVSPEGPRQVPGLSESCDSLQGLVLE